MNLSTGEMYTQEEYEAIPVAKRAKMPIVKLTPEESEHLSSMNRKERRKWAKENYKLSRRERDAKVAKRSR